MATGRTISASFLTEFDLKVIQFCENISSLIFDKIDDLDLKNKYKNEYGKISKTRDGGLGLGGGKLQRDALCTRERQGKAPFSNRNLRWHPLIVAENKPSYAKEIERIRIKGDGESKVLIFYIKDSNNRLIEFPSDKAHELPSRYVTLPKHWLEHVDELKHWNDTLWTQNSCIIPALEACDWVDSIETYAVLGISIAVEFFKVDFKKLYHDVYNLLKNQSISKQVSLPSRNFPSKKENFVKCPLCLCSISLNPSEIPPRLREITWQPSWNTNKRSEGEDSSIQIMHVNPLVEKELRHNAANVRYGHRWCNVSMTDHSISETLDFMEFIVKAHKRWK